MKKITTLLLCLTICVGIFAREPRRIFTTQLERLPDAATCFEPGGAWLPYPAYEDRAGWDSFVGEARETILKNGNKALKYTWDTTLGKKYSVKNRDQLGYLFLAELVAGDGRYLPKMAEFLRALCIQPTLANNNDRYPNGGTPLELGTSSTAMDLALPWFYFKDKLEELDPGLPALIVKRIEEEVFEQYMNPKKEQTWMGLSPLKGDQYLNNWNPYCNFFIAVAFLLVEQDREKLNVEMRRVLRSVDSYIDFVAMDGSCDEGPSYWSMAGAKIYEFARMICDVTNGRINVLGDEQIRLMGEWRSYVDIGHGQVANFSDCSPLSSDTCADLMFRAGVDTGSSVMTGYSLFKYARPAENTFALPNFNTNKVWRCLEMMRYMPALKEAESKTTPAAAATYKIPSKFFQDTQTAFLRAGDFYLAAKGGHNAESHNHNDVGSGLLYFDGIPLLIDPGVNHEAYGWPLKQAGKTKYEIWSPNSDWHNTPSPNGAIQAPGRKMAARDASCEGNRFSIDIAGAYPEEACCNSWKRTWNLDASGLEIKDEYSLSKRTDPDVIYFTLCADVFLPGEEVDGIKVKKNEVYFRGRTKKADRTLLAKMVFSPGLKVTAETRDVTKVADMKKSWGPAIQRLVFTSSAKAPLNGSYSFKVVKAE